jgi:hypothetical protein
MFVATEGGGLEDLYLKNALGLIPFLSLNGEPHILMVVETFRNRRRKHSMVDQ